MTYAGRRPPADVLETVSAIYHASFPPAERMPWETLVDGISGGTRVLWTDDDATAFALSKTLPTVDGDVLLEYLAVDPTRRNAGTGGRLLDHLLTSVDGPVVLEVEDPAHSDDPHSTRRLRFYERHGCVPIQCAGGYAMPVVEAHEAVATVPMFLYEAAGRTRSVPLSGVALRRLVSAIWVDSYECVPDAQRLRDTLSLLVC
jgi:GNAT superfamily N-acetyltransferase